MLLTGLFILFRQLERWLHQHIFKVGWLITRNFNVTTVLYYTLFFPGIVLHELVSWLVAGALNVHATQAIAWPQQQEIGELRLNFVRINPNIPPWKRFVISLSPLVAGMLLTWHIAENVFHLDDMFQTMSSGALVDVAAAFEALLATPDFWLWFYLLFTVSNTMFASLERNLRNMRSILALAAAVVAAILIVGATSATFSFVASPFEHALLVLAELLVVLIVVNFVATLFLGTLETFIERFSSHSVTFRGGRMDTISREELAQQREQRRLEAQQRSRRATRPAKSEHSITSIYKLAFPVPGAPANAAPPQTTLNIDRPKAAPKATRPPTSPVPSAPAARPSISLTTLPAVAEPVPLPPQPAAEPAAEKPAVKAENPSPPVPQESTPPARPATSPFPRTPAQPTADEDDAPPAPARPAISPFPRTPATSPKPIPSLSAEDERLDADELPDPFSDVSARPAAPRNPLYQQGGITPAPLNPARPAPKSIRVMSDDDAARTLNHLMSRDRGKDDLAYEPDEEYYSEDDEYPSHED